MKLRLARSYRCCSFAWKGSHLVQKTVSPGDCAAEVDLAVEGSKVGYLQGSCVAEKSASCKDYAAEADWAVSSSGRGHGSASCTLSLRRLPSEVAVRRLSIYNSIRQADCRAG